MNKFQKVASKISIRESRLKRDYKLYREIKSSYLIGFRTCNYNIKDALNFKNEHKKYLEYVYEYK